MIRRPPRSTQSRSSAASDVYKRQLLIGSLANLPLQRLNKFAPSRPAGLPGALPGQPDLPASAPPLAGAGHSAPRLSRLEVRSAAFVAAYMAFIVALLAFSSLARQGPGY